VRLHDLETRVALWVSRFAGSPPFVYLHIVGFTLWLVLGGRLGDPWPYSLLTMAVSLEAIFLAAFILLAQHRLEETIEEQAEEEQQEDKEFDEDLDEIQTDLDVLRAGMEALQKSVARVEKRVRKADEKPL